MPNEPQIDIMYEGLEHWDKVREAADDFSLAFEIGVQGEARFVQDLHDGTKMEIIYWSEDEFNTEPELFQKLAIEAIQQGAYIRRMTRDGVIV